MNTNKQSGFLKAKSNIKPNPQSLIRQKEELEKKLKQLEEENEQLKKNGTVYTGKKRGRKKLTEEQKVDKKTILISFNYLEKELLLNNTSNSTTYIKDAVIEAINNNVTSKDLSNIDIVLNKHLIPKSDKNRSNKKAIVFESKLLDEIKDYAKKIGKTTSGFIREVTLKNILEKNNLNLSENLGVNKLIPLYKYEKNIITNYLKEKEISFDKLVLDSLSIFKDNKNKNKTLEIINEINRTVRLRFIHEFNKETKSDEKNNKRYRSTALSLFIPNKIFELLPIEFEEIKETIKTKNLSPLIRGAVFKYINDDINFL